MLAAFGEHVALMWNRKFTEKESFEVTDGGKIVARIGQQTKATVLCAMEHSCKGLAEARDILSQVIRRPPWLSVISGWFALKMSAFTSKTSDHPRSLAAPGSALSRVRRQFR
ncbi:hypothetical protein CA13_24130 [Planctomycetes bacterium CA13]|uniref:Uncharacterized protein n=1 Tax=Novipirellula herctigrandis TaxID=2527986 RepID=A0A5C5Z1T5_9BACT|nr:hypothetical protein CA13_24130 [Planctomycetes bacterium CA13]